MKSRYWWIIGGLVALLAVGIMLSQRGFLLGKSNPSNETVTPEAQAISSLQSCDGTQNSFIGQLVPEQTAAKQDSNLSEMDPNATIQKNGWSTRAGFSISSTTDPEYWAERLGSGWYIDWNFREKTALEGLEYWSMVRVHENCISPSLVKIQSVAAQFPGQVWIIGNEPDVIWQDNVSAARYAYAYHEMYQAIKFADPSARVAAGGISQATPLRLQYLDQVLQAYRMLYAEPMPADWWTVHGYVLREEKGSWGVDIPPGIDATQGELREVSDHGRIDLFESQIRAFRQWMAERGYQDSPLALTEFGILMPESYGFPPEMVGEYLQQTFTWLDQAQDETIGNPDDGYRLVQKWAWFSLSDPNYSTANLGDLPSGKLTLLGEKFRNVVATMEP